MHDYLFSADAVRLAFILGIIASMLYYERRQITTGSIVVPGYIALFVMQPSVIVVTFANALFCYWLVNRVLSRRVLLYGRSKFTVLAITSMALQALMLKLSPSGSWLWEADIPLMVGIGYVIPALIAHDMARQGIRKTIAAVLTTGMLVVVPVVLALLFVSNVQAGSVLVSFESVLLPPEWIPFAVVLSAAASWGLLSNHGLRQGGFVGGAFVGMLWANPGQVAYVMGIAVLTWAIVSRVLMPHIILFGRRKFAMMLMVAALLSWIGMWIGTRYLGLNPGAYVTITAIPLTPLFLPGLLANDMDTRLAATGRYRLDSRGTLCDSHHNAGHGALRSPQRRGCRYPRAGLGIDHLDHLRAPARPDRGMALSAPHADCRRLRLSGARSRTGARLRQYRTAHSPQGLGSPETTSRGVAPATNRLVLNAAAGPGRRLFNRLRGNPAAGSHRPRRHPALPRTACRRHPHGRPRCSANVSPR